MMKQSIRLAATPDRHEESVGDELSRHLGLHRPADNKAGKKIDHSGDVEPALGHSDIGEVGDPLLIWPLRRELAIEDIWRDCGHEALTFVLRQGAPAGSSPQALRPHQPLDFVESATYAIGQNISPDAARSIGSRACDKACPDLRRQRFVRQRACAWTTGPGQAPGGALYEARSAWVGSLKGKGSVRLRCVESQEADEGSEKAE